MALDFLDAGSAGARRLFACASEALGQDCEALLRTSGAEALCRTDLSQPLLTLADLSAAAFLAERGFEPAGCAGFSLGEYAALAVCGVLGEEACFALVTERGRAMQACVDALSEPAGMAAVVGLDAAHVDAVLASALACGAAAPGELFAANRNAARQVVISGTERALAAAEGLFREAGARRFVRLAVAGPFHSPLMAPAAERFAAFLESLPFADPRIPLYSNVSGRRVRSGIEAKALAARHMTSAVRWTDEEQAIIAEQVFDAALEVGPGSVLAGLWRDTGSAAPCHAAGTAADIRRIYAAEE
jgi:[acyl-carrier-protein] S-malonyltransferase